MIKLIVEIEVKPEYEQEMAQTLQIIQSASRKEIGCVYYNVFQQFEKPYCWLVDELWRDREALEQHNQTPHFQAISPQLAQWSQGVTVREYIVPAQGFEANLNLSSDAFFGLISSRRSIRNFTAQEVGKEKIERLLQAGMHAPSAHNYRPWEYVVVTQPHLRKQLSELTLYSKPAGLAPVNIVVCGNAEKFEKDPHWWTQDLSASAQNILLQAHAEGLGGVWLGFFPDEQRIDALRQVLGLPSHIFPFTVLAIGHPEKWVPPVNRWEPEKIHWNQY